METLKKVIHRVKALIRLYRVKQYCDQTTADKFHMFAEKINALEEFKSKYCNEKYGRTSLVSKNCRAYNKLKNELKKEILNELYNL